MLLITRRNSQTSIECVIQKKRKGGKKKICKVEEAKYQLEIHIIRLEERMF